MYSVKHKLLIALLAFGTVAGFGSGFAHMACHHRQRRAQFEQHVARVCVDAARQADGEAGPWGGMDAPPPPGGPAAAGPGWQGPGWQGPGWQGPGWQGPGWQGPGWQGHRGPRGHHGGRHGRHRGPHHGPRGAQGPQLDQGAQGPQGSAGPQAGPDAQSQAQEGRAGDRW